MVNVDEQGKVDGGGREAGVAVGAQDGGDVGDAGAGEAVGEVGEHWGLDINGKDTAAGADGPGEAPGEITGAGADVGDGVARFEVEETEDGVRRGGSGRAAGTCSQH